MRTNLGTHFQKGDMVKLNKNGQGHKHLMLALGMGAHIVESVKFTDNLDYADQFVYVGRDNGFYNTIFEIVR